MATTKEDHLNWCKQRALEYVNTGDLENAWVSMVSDLKKYDETRDHVAINLGNMMLVGGHLNSKEEMKKFIEGFN